MERRAIISYSFNVLGPLFLLLEVAWPSLDKKVVSSPTIACYVVLVDITGNVLFENKTKQKQ